MMGGQTFKAIMAMEPFGVLCVTPDDLQLFTGPQWMKLRGAAAHRSDIRNGRTVTIDHFRFNPRRRMHCGAGELGRRFISLDMNTIRTIYDCGPDWTTDGYLGRIFSQSEIDLIQDAMTILAYAFHGKPLPGWLIDAAREL